MYTCFLSFQHIHRCSSTIKERTNGSKAARSSNRLSIPLGIQTKKAEFLRRGSPKPRSARPHGPSASEMTYQRWHSSKKVKTTDNTSDGLVGSKNPSKHHP